MDPRPVTGAAYSAAGVDVEAGELAVRLMRQSVAAASRPEVVGSLGGFAGLFDATALTRMKRPLLATSTDGVGTKVSIAARLDRHDTIGMDLVAMVVDDLVVCGAEPLFMTDYIACGRVIPERIAAIVSGIAASARQAGCALLGGETAEHPGLLDPDEYDIAGAATGVVEAEALLGPDRVRSGDLLIGLPSSGLHSNGYSLARHVLFSGAGWTLDRHVPELGRTLGEELLEPTVIYSRACLGLARQLPAGVHAFSHVTGGGIAANLARVLPPGLFAELDRARWTPHPIFALIGDLGRIDRAELERTFNMGLGMIAVVGPADGSVALEHLRREGVDARLIGEIRPARDGEASDAAPKGGAGGGARLINDYR